jgi:alpha-tubulin suppressor-like RCC1 family protein
MYVIIVFIYPHLEQGYIFSFGNNLHGQLGIGDKSIKFSTAPLLVSDLISKKPLKIQCGSDFTSILTTEGDLFLWGSNTFGQCNENPHLVSKLFQPKRLSLPSLQIKDFSLGFDFLYFTTFQNDIFSLGSNSDGQLS